MNTVDTTQRYDLLHSFLMVVKLTSGQTDDDNPVRVDFVVGLNNGTYHPALQIHAFEHPQRNVVRVMAVGDRLFISYGIFFEEDRFVQRDYTYYSLDDSTAAARDVIEWLNNED